MGANNDYSFPQMPLPNELGMPLGSSLMPPREENFRDPNFKEDVYPDPDRFTYASILTVSGLYRPYNSGLSNGINSTLSDLNFNSYIHYISNDNGGIGLIDKTPYEIKASIIYSRSNSFQSYSPY